MTITKKIKVSELPEFDAAEYLNSEEDVAAYLTTVLEENDPALLAAALGDIARSRGMSQLRRIPASRGKLCTRPCDQAANRASTRSAASVPPSACAWSPSLCMPLPDDALRVRRDAREDRQAVLRQS